jgi:ATP-dependent phosphoenolpyruvate carboxykinase
MAIGYEQDDYDRLYKRIQEEIDTEDLTLEDIEKYLGKKTKERTKLAKKIAEAGELLKKINQAPSKEKLKEIKEEIKEIPVKRQELKEAEKSRRKELTPIEKFAKEKKIKLSKYKIGRIEDRKDSSQWVTIRSNRKGTKGRIITAMKLK